MIIITTPIFLPVVTTFGIDPVHFGVIMILNLGIGLNTPPLGPVQFVAAAVGKITIWEAMRSIWPFYGAGHRRPPPRHLRAGPVALAAVALPLRTAPMPLADLPDGRRRQQRHAAASSPRAPSSCSSSSPSPPTASARRTATRHVQSTFVKSGRFAFTVAGETFEVGPGDAFVIPSNAVHGCRALGEPGVLIDTFTPRRDDFL